MEKLSIERHAPVYWESCLDSTSSQLALMKETVSGTVLVADRQSGGRGRQGRSFISPEGGIYLSMLLKPKCDGGRCTELTPLAAIAVHRTLKKSTGLSAGIKWPNDLLLDGKKFCGILTELSFDDDGDPRVILGIGVNLNSEIPSELEAIACSVFEHRRRMTNKEAFLQQLIFELDECYATWEKEGCFFLEEYRELNLCLGREILIISAGESRKAIARDINPDMSLAVEYEDGQKENLYYGEISLRL